MSDLGDRRTYLGASELATALGLRGPGERLELWAYKTGRAPAPPHKRIFDRGHDMEDVIIKMLEREHGIEVQARQKEFTAAVVQRSWLRCHVDGICPDHTPIPGGGGGEKKRGWGILEVKAPGDRAVQTWREIGMPDDYVLQTQAQMFCANHHKAGNHSAFQWGRFAFLDYENYTLPCFDLDYDEKWFADLLPEIDAFWKCVKKDTRPPEMPEKPIQVPEIDGTLIVAQEGTELHEKCETAAEYYLSVKMYEEKFERAKKAAIKAMGRHGKVRIEDLAAISYYFNKGKDSIKATELHRWTSELCEAMRAGDVDKVLKMADAWDNSLFLNKGKPYPNFRVTPIGTGKDYLEREKGAEL